MSSPRTAIALSLLLALSIAATDTLLPDEPPAGDSTPVDEALRRMRVPAGFEVRLVASEPDIVQPVAQAHDEKGRLWVLECLEYPNGARAGAEPRDRLKILEDTDGDARADRIQVFAKGLDLATGFAIGYGGVFVGQAPHLLFIPDRDRDDVPDGPPEVLLEGWGRQDTHELLNSFIWGPDGWLYGCHGVFTHSVVRKIAFSAAIWRYHPRTRAFEIFAEGTSNPWGFDFDEHGQGFLTACVIPHLFHMVPGGLYMRQAGSNANPYAYGELREISDHKHYQEGRYHSRNTDPEVYGGGHAHCGALIYQGDNFPAEYRGSILMGNVHGNRVNRDVFERRGSTYVGKHAPDILAANDLRFRATSLITGPDGAVTILDWHDVQNCHNTRADIWDRSNGRVFKLVYTGGKPELPRARVGDLKERSSAELVKLLDHPNEWWGRMANRILSERQDASVHPTLRELALAHADERGRLRALWALGATGGLDEGFARALLSSDSEWIRSWTVRLLGEPGAVSPGMLARFLELAASDPSPEVRRQLASTCLRLRSGAGEVLRRLALRGEDAADPVIPLLVWIGLEKRLLDEESTVVPWLVEHSGSPLVERHIIGRAARRFASDKDPAALAAAVRLAGAPSLAAGIRRNVLQSVIDGLGSRKVDPPREWKEAQARLRADASPEVRKLASKVAARFRSAEAADEALAAAADASLPAAERADAVRTLGAQIEDPRAVPVLAKLFPETSSDELRMEALRALRRFQDAPLVDLLLGRWSELAPSVRTEALDALAGRREWARALLGAIEAGRVPRDAVDVATARRIAALGDDDCSALLEKAWGRLGAETGEEITARIERLRKVLQSETGDFERGAASFEKRCAQCHSLYGKGHKVGPELDGAARHDLEYLLRNIVHPNEVVGRDYYATALLLDDGQLVQGILASKDASSITLRREKDALESFPLASVRQVIPSEVSMMPEGLTKDMTDGEFRDLIAYMVASPYLSRVRVAGPFRGGEEDLLEARLPPELVENPLEAAGVSWKEVDAGSWGEVDVAAHGGGGNQNACYVLAEVEAPEEMRTELHIGSDDALKVWVNGKRLHQYGSRRRAVRDADRVPAVLAAGRNRILIKVVNRIPGRSTLTVRLVDPGRRLR